MTNSEDVHIYPLSGCYDVCTGPGTFVNTNISDPGGGNIGMPFKPPCAQNIMVILFYFSTFVGQDEEEKIYFIYFFVIRRPNPNWVN